MERIRTHVYIPLQGAEEAVRFDTRVRLHDDVIRDDYVTGQLREFGNRERFVEVSWQRGRARGRGTYAAGDADVSLIHGEGGCVVGGGGVWG